MNGSVDIRDSGLLGGEYQLDCCRNRPDIDAVSACVVCVDGSEGPDEWTLDGEYGVGVEVGATRNEDMRRQRPVPVGPGDEMDMRGPVRVSVCRFQQRSHRAVRRNRVVAGSVRQDLSVGSAHDTRHQQVRRTSDLVDRVAELPNGRLRHVEGTENRAVGGPYRMLVVESLDEHRHTEYIGEQ